MKNLLLLISIFLFGVHLNMHGQSIDYTLSTLGVTFNGPDYGGNNIDRMEVEPNGQVHTFSGWDEIQGGGRYCTYQDGKLIDHKSFNIHNTQVTDKNGKTWTILNQQDYIYTPGNDTIKCSDGRFITDAQGPRALAIANDGKLMVGEFGPRSQVRFYDISGTPVFDHSFGDSLGIFADSVPGRMLPMRFRDIKGVGMDGSGNIYVGMGCFFGGNKIQCYTPAGKKIWEVNNLFFVDNGDIDPSTDGKDIYTKSHHFTVDYTKPDGQQWIDTAYTLNRFKYPDDARLHPEAQGTAPSLHPSSTWVRYLDGKKILIVNDMFTDQLRMYRFNRATDGEVAIPSVLYVKKNVKPFLFNFNQFFLDTVKILAKSYCEKRGTADEASNVANIQSGCYLAYCNVNFGAGKNTFKASTSAPAYGAIIGGVLELHVDSLTGRIIASDTTRATSGWGDYQTFSANITDTVTGIHKIYILLKYPNPNKWPKTQPDFGQWLWTDSNGNGQMDNGEYQAPGNENSSSGGGYWVDKALNLWLYGTNITKIPFEGFDAYGNPKYTLGAAVSVPAPTSVAGFKRLEYDSDSDKMYVLGTTQIAKYSNWSSNKTTPEWVMPVSGNQSMSIAGDYLFAIDDISASNKIYTYSLLDGKYVGKMGPKGGAGLIDIPYGVRAFKRTNGEYMVLAEEDWLAYIRLYRFTNLLPNQPPVVNITKPTANQQFSTSPLITAVATDADGTITKVQLYIDSVKVADTRTFTWSDATLGKHKVFAWAYDNYGDSIKSATVPFEITNTGVNVVTDTQLNIYPNPAADKVYVKLSANTEKIGNVSLIDMTGKILILKKIRVSDISELDISGIPNGLYFVKITTSGNDWNCKLEINK